MYKLGGSIDLDVYGTKMRRLVLGWIPYETYKGITFWHCMLIHNTGCKLAIT